MLKYSKYILAFFGVVIFSTVFWASSRGWGIPTVTNRSVIQEAQNCPPEQRDAWGNCPTRTTRSSIRSRYFSGDGNGSGGK